MTALDEFDARLAELLAAWRDDIDSVPHAPGLVTSALLARLEAA